MKIRTLMHREVATCRPEDPMAVAARIMWEKDCGIVPVVEGEGAERRLVGVVTDRDLCMAGFTRDLPLSRMPVRLAMAKQVFACREEDDRSKVHEMMRRHKIRRVPVTDEKGRLLGMVSLNDLAVEYAESRGSTSAKLKHEVAQTLAEISRHREAAVV